MPAIAVGTAMIAAQAVILRMSSFCAIESWARFDLAASRQLVVTGHGFMYPGEVVLDVSEYARTFGSTTQLGPGVPQRLGERVDSTTDSISSRFT